MTDRSILTTTALAGAMAAVLAATPALAADAVKVEKMTTQEQVTRSEADIKAHDAAEPNEGPAEGEVRVGEDTDVNDDGDLIAEKPFDADHSEDDLGGNADTDGDGDLIANEPQPDTAGANAAGDGDMAPDTTE